MEKWWIDYTHVLVLIIDMTEDIRYPQKLK